MESVFLSEARRNLDGRIPVTLLFIEVLKDLQPTLEDEDTQTVLQAALVEAGLIELGTILDDEVAIELLTRIQPKPKKEEQVSTESRQPRSRKRSFGSEFVEAFEKMSIVEKCLYAADFDYEYARKLYCEFDREVAEEVIKAKIAFDTSMNNVRFEAVVIGMGGSFSNNPGSPTNGAPGEVVDFAPEGGDHDQFIAAAKQFQAMQHSYRRG